MALCTQADVEDILSVEGVLLATDDERAGSTVTSNVTNAIARATARFNAKVYKFYTLTALTGNEFARWCAAYMSISQLFIRRANMLPASIQEEIAGWMEHLDKVEAGTAEIPGATRRFEQTGMSMSNLRYDMRYAVAKARVEHTISTGPTDSRVARRFDRRSYLDFDL